MSPNSDHDVAARLQRLVAEIEAAKRSRQRHGRGRPDGGIRSGYIRIETYVPPDIVAGLDRLAERMAQQTGKSTARSHIVRVVLRAYLREQLPDVEL
jgi:hypothetical protein